MKTRVFETIHTLNKTKEIKKMKNKNIFYLSQAAMILSLIHI